MTNPYPVIGYPNEVLSTQGGVIIREEGNDTILSVKGSQIIPQDVPHVQGYNSKNGRKISYYYQPYIVLGKFSSSS